MRLLSISEFAAACGLSVPAVRRYGEAGVLRPARVDERTGYRWYDVEQIATGTLVRSLRELDVPLSAVAVILQDTDPAAQLARLEQHWLDVERSVRRGRAARDHLARLLGGWQDLIDEHRVVSRPVGELPVLLRRRRIHLRELAGHVERAVGLLRERAHREALEVIGAPVSLYPGPNERLLEEVDRLVEVCLPVRAAQPRHPDPGAAGTTGGAAGEGVGDAVLPAGELLFTEVTGSHAGYPQVLAAYGAVSQWAHQHDRLLTDPPLMVHLAAGRVQVGWRLPPGPELPIARG